MMQNQTNSAVSATTRHPHIDDAAALRNLELTLARRAAAQQPAAKKEASSHVRTVGDVLAAGHVYMPNQTLLTGQGKERRAVVYFLCEKGKEKTFSVFPNALPLEEQQRLGVKPWRAPAKKAAAPRLTAAPTAPRHKKAGSELLTTEQMKARHEAKMAAKEALAKKPKAAAPKKADKDDDVVVVPARGNSGKKGNQGKKR